MTESLSGTDTGPYGERTSSDRAPEADAGADTGSHTDPDRRPDPTSEPDDTTAPGPASGNGAEPTSDPSAGLVQQVEVGAADGAVLGPGHVDRPIPLSAGLSVAAGALAVLLVANAAGQVIALGIGLGGAVALAGGIEARHRGHRLLGLVLLTLGVVGAGAAVGWAVIGTASVDNRIEVLPALFGLPVLMGGVTAAWRGYERLFLSVGTGAILLTIFVSGMVEDAAIWALLGATALTVVSWDCGEQGINLGQQIGRQARTRRAELVHGGAGLLVGVIGVGVGVAFVTLGVTGLPLMGLTTLLAAVVVLAAGLYL